MYRSDQIHHAEHKYTFIFLTANCYQAIVNPAKLTQYNANLIKPFNKNELYSAIEIVLYNYNDNIPASNKELNLDKVQKMHKKCAFIKDGEKFHKVLFDDIIYLCTKHVNIELHTA